MRRNTCDISHGSSVAFAPHASRLIASLCAMLCIALAGCGFQPARRRPTLPFNTLYVEAPHGVAVRDPAAPRDRRGQPDAHHQQSADADATLQVLNELREKEILSLSAGGRVRELQLRYRVQYQVYDKNKAPHRAARRDRAAARSSRSTTRRSSPRNRKKRCSTATCRPTPCSSSCGACRPREPSRADACRRYAGP